MSIMEMEVAPGETIDVQQLREAESAGQVNRYPLADLVEFMRPRSWENMSVRLGMRVADLRELHKRGLTHKEADHLACKAGVVPYMIWPEWLFDDSDEACYDATPPAIQEYAGVRFSPGGLTAAILEIAQRHLGEPISPASVARELGRQKPTPIYIRMRSMAERGQLRKCQDSPARYCLDKPVDIDKPSTDFVAFVSQPQ